MGMSPDGSMIHAIKQAACGPARGGSYHGERGKGIWLLSVLLIVGVLAIPLAVLGYGVNEDSARGVRAADRLWTTGAYYPSRLPGNPLFEYLLVPFVHWGGPLETNLLVFGFYVGGVIAFWRLARQFPDGRLLTAMLALTPIVVVNSATTLDYIPGLTMMLWAYCAAGRHRFAAVSILLALAIGFRISNVVFGISLFVYLLMSGARWHRAGICCLAGGVLGGLFYLPILARVGTRMLELPERSGSIGYWVLIGGYNGLMLFGPLATLAVGVVLGMSWRTVASSLRAAFRERFAPLALEILTVGLFCGLFLVHPSETAYLLPVVPFLYLLLGRWISTRKLVLVGVFVVAFAFVSIELRGGESGRRHLTIRPTSGIVISNLVERRDKVRLRQRIAQFDLSDRAILITGLESSLTFRNPQLRRVDYIDVSPRLSPQIDPVTGEVREIHKIRGKRVYLVYALARGDCIAMESEGFDLYMSNRSAPATAMLCYGYDPDELGIRKIDLLKPGALREQDNSNDDSRSFSQAAP